MTFNPFDLLGINSTTMTAPQTQGLARYLPAGSMSFAPSANSLPVAQPGMAPGQAGVNFMNQNIGYLPGWRAQFPNGFTPGMPIHPASPPAPAPIPVAAVAPPPPPPDPTINQDVLNSMSQSAPGPRAQGGLIGYMRGGRVRGHGATDHVNIKAMPGEYMMDRNTVNAVGPRNLALLQMAANAARGTVPGQVGNRMPSPGGGPTPQQILSGPPRMAAGGMVGDDSWMPTSGDDSSFMRVLQMLQNSSQVANRVNQIRQLGGGGAPMGQQPQQQAQQSLLSNPVALAQMMNMLKKSGSDNGTGGKMGMVPLSNMFTDLTGAGATGGAQLAQEGAIGGF
jgi:hypothetical protein